MRIDVLLFAQLAEALGTDRLTIDLARGASAGAALAALLREHPALAPHRAGVALAVNERYVRAEHALADGDVLALIPPVSGG